MVWILRSAVMHLARLGAFGAAWLLAAIGLLAVASIHLDGLVDAHAFWVVLQSPLRYPTTFALGAPHYVYPPPMAQLLTPLSALSWPAFAALWLAMAAAAYAWLLAPVRLPLRVPLWVAAVTLASDNIYWLLALTAALALERPALWSAPLLTKVGPGIGITWFAFRGEWRSFAVACAWTLLIAFASFAIAPEPWRDWVALMGTQDLGTTGWYGLGPLPLRLAIAAALLLMSARRDWKWAIPIAMILGEPDIWISAFGLLAALPRLADPNVDGNRGHASLPRRRPECGRGTPTGAVHSLYGRLSYEHGEARIPNRRHGQQQGDRQALGSIRPRPPEKEHYGCRKPQ